MGLKVILNHLHFQFASEHISLPVIILIAYRLGTNFQIKKAVSFTETAFKGIEKKL